MDIRVSGQGSEDARWRRVSTLANELVRAGGTVLHPFDKHHVVMADPEGNEFCLGFTGADDGRHTEPRPASEPPSTGR
jgi:hypothetical protein